MRRSCLVIAVALACLAAPRAASAAALRPVESTLPAQLSGVTVGAPADPAQPLQVGVLLAHPHPAREDALLHALYDRASPSFHQFLTPAQYTARFGVPSSQRRAVRDWLAGGGLHVESVSGAGDYLLASGSVADVSRLAHVRIDRMQRGRQAFVGNVDAPRVPSSLPVLGLSGLSTLQRYQPLATHAAAGVPDPGTRTPEELWSIYQQPDSAKGAGVSVAILGSGKSDSVIADLHKFDDEHHFKQLPVDVTRTPANAPVTDDSGDVEWNIDMQAIHGMAPDIDKEELYFSPTLADSQLVASLATWVNDPSGPPIMNASLGECEQVPVVNPILNNAALQPINGNNGGTFPVTQAVSQASEPQTTQLLQQAVMEGRTFFAASGDNGSSCSVVYAGDLGGGNGVANQVAPLTSDPASVPFATGVGGTVLYSDGNTPAGRFLERAWEYSGGNPSPFIPAPDYQKDVPNLTRDCVADANLQPRAPGTLCRGVPDVSALSGDVVSNGYAIVSDGKDSQGGGTSLSSPLWAGMWARVVGQAPKGSLGYGFANPALYAIAKDPTRDARSFYDITVGTNGLNPALKGYDYVTGLGAPRVSGLLTDVPAVAPAVFPKGSSAGAGTGTGASVGGSGSLPASCHDTSAPTSRFRARISHAGVSVTGTAKDAGCAGLSSVSVSIAREVGRKCRFLRADGRFGKTVSCLRTTYVPAHGTSSWTLRIRHHLPAGRYKVFSRATDRRRNIERKARNANFARVRLR